MWEGRPPSGYVATLHGYVSVLRRGLSRIGAEDVLITSAQTYLLDEEEVMVDLAVGRGLLDSLEPESVLDALEMAAHGLLVDEPYAEWATEVRNDWDAAVAVSATRAAGTARGRGEHGTAIRLARAAQKASPYCEAALCEHMLALAETGQVGPALQVFYDARRRLRADLGVEPQADTEAIYLDLLRAAPSQGVDEIPILVRLLREAMRAGEGVDTLDPMLRDVRRVLLERAG
jgi:DNA-binding SARP family transcriptional activator